MAGAEAVPTPLPRAIAIVPARLGSTRLARKMLLDETGWPLVVHTAKNIEDSGAFARVVVATDAAEVVRAAEPHGIEAVLTRADHPSGTDRVVEAFDALTEEGSTVDVVVNVQGDEPELEPRDLRALVGTFADTAVELATLAVPIEDPAELSSPAVVKVVCDAAGDALYFSRAAVPNADHARSGAGPATGTARRHIGVYAFRPDALKRFHALPVGRLEALENLEQLRWLEAGRALRVVDAEVAPAGIDTRADYEAFVARWRETHKHVTPRSSEAR